ncbi:MAG TPA: hypothetical protein PK659_01245 [Methanothrix sp.]|nr:hypothetical protein [Methanothrix sp.]HOK57597.1 hypothetical protein [Methanothrix sp.]HOL42866.1 hypothetical protein [Methanothrix sp.]HPO87881.1 hypothetical protein [Methanothrix sp.]
MNEYMRIAELLSSRSRDRISALASLLRSLPQEEICPAVRLLTGGIRPSWSPGELTGRGVVMDALLSISDQIEGGDLGEMAEHAIRHKRQSGIDEAPLTIGYVHSVLNSVMISKGRGSEKRRRSMLTGLLLSSAPLEGRYIALTATGIRSGIGPRTVASAISRAFGVDIKKVWAAYSRHPEMGRVAEAASSGALDGIRLTPGVPFVMMEIPKLEIASGQVPLTGSDLIFCARRGIRVQLHLSEGRSWLFTTRRRDVSHIVSRLRAGLIGSAMLEGEMRAGNDLSQITRLINRRRSSRRSSIRPSIIIWDAVCIDNREIVDLAYSERFRLASEVVRKIEGDALELSIVEPLDPAEALQDGLPVVARSPSAPYLLGRRSRVDFQIVPRRPQAFHGAD